MYVFLVQLAEPFTLGMLGLLGAVVFGWARRIGSLRFRIWLTGTTLLLQLWCTPFVSQFFASFLESPYSPRATRPEGTHAIVVLSSGSVGGATEQDLPEPDLASYLRCRKAADLYRAGPPCPIVLSGGKLDPRHPGETFAMTLRRTMIHMGVPEHDLILEDRSRDTYENAAYTAQILRSRGYERVVLVTTATHLMRSEWCFKLQGLEVHPIGCDFKSPTGPHLTLYASMPRLGGARLSQEVFHEALGYVWYKLRSLF